MFLDLLIALVKLLVDAGSLILFGSRYFNDETGINKKMDPFNYNADTDEYGFDYESPSTLEWNRSNAVVGDSMMFRHRHYYDNRPSAAYVATATAVPGITSPVAANANAALSSYSQLSSTAALANAAPHPHIQSHARAQPHIPMLHPYYPQYQQQQQQSQVNTLQRPSTAEFAIGDSTTLNNTLEASRIDADSISSSVNTPHWQQYAATAAAAVAVAPSNNDSSSESEDVSNAMRLRQLNTIRSKSLELPKQQVGYQRKGLRDSKPIVQVDRLSLLSRLSSEYNEQQQQQQQEQQQQQQQQQQRRRRSSGGDSINSSAGTDNTSDNDNATAAASASLEKMRRHSANFPTIALEDLSLLHLIGGGGFGQVWKGTWGGTPVAVKLLSNICQYSAMPHDLLSSFEEEVSILSQLRHPNICLFLGVCMEPPHRAIVTELVARGSLWDALRIPGLLYNSSSSSSNSSSSSSSSSSSCNSSSSVMTAERYWLPWPSQTVKRVLEGTCRGLIYLHSHSPPIIHRDLKSANLLLDETFNVKICDFGLARLRDFTTVLTANVGTIQWMAPEVLTGSEYSESADIYSVGIVMWEMFTGACPYEGMKQVEVALSVVQRNLRPIIPTSCTVAQANLMRRCWATDPAQRLSAQQLLKEIDSAFKS